jgi:hypothetical protein
MNGGTCVDKEGGSMVCNCPLGYAGDICDIVGSAPTAAPTAAATGTSGTTSKSIIDSDAAGKSPYCGTYNMLILMSTIIAMLEVVYPTLL